MYLADSSIREKVEWVRDGSAHKLIVKTENAGIADTNTDNGEDDAQEMAVLSAIVHITREDFYMASDGGYRGPGRFNQPFSDIKLSCTGGRPKIEELGNDFDRVIGNLKWLEEQVVTPGFHDRKGLLTGLPSSPKIKIRHKLFEVTIRYILKDIQLH
jgi:hypothetical protein